MNRDVRFAIAVLMQVFSLVPIALLRDYALKTAEQAAQGLFFIAATMVLIPLVVFLSWLKEMGVFEEADA